MDKKNILLIFISLGIAAIGFYNFFVSKNPDNVGNSEDGIILFYQTGCSYCKIVDDYIKENNVEEKVVFQKKEVLSNQNNAALMSQKASICGLSLKNIGVPFLWTGEKCLIGDKDIVNFFQQEINK